MKVLLVLQPDDQNAEIASGEFYDAVSGRMAQLLLHLVPSRRRKIVVAKAHWTKVDDIKSFLIQAELMWKASAKSWGEVDVEAPAPEPQEAADGLSPIDRAHLAALRQGCCSDCKGEGHIGGEPCVSCLGTGHPHDPDLGCS